MDPTPISEKSNKNIKRNDYSEDSDIDYGSWKIVTDNFNC